MSWHRSLHCLLAQRGLDSLVGRHQVQQRRHGAPLAIGERIYGVSQQLATERERCQSEPGRRGRQDIAACGLVQELADRALTFRGVLFCPAISRYTARVAPLPTTSLGVIHRPSSVLLFDLDHVLGGHAPAVHRDPCEFSLDLLKLGRHQLHAGSAQIFLEVLKAARARDRNDPRLLSQ